MLGVGRPVVFSAGFPIPTSLATGRLTFWIFHIRRSRRRQLALISEDKKLAPTDVGGYTLRPFSSKCTTHSLSLSFS